MVTLLQTIFICRDLLLFKLPYLGNLFKTEKIGIFLEPAWSGQGLESISRRGHSHQEQIKEVKIFICLVRNLENTIAFQTHHWFNIEEEKSRSD